MAKKSSTSHKIFLILLIIAVALMFWYVITEPQAALIGIGTGITAALMGFRYLPAPLKFWIAGPKNFYLRR